jgi:hypothetical protein
MKNLRTIPKLGVRPEKVIFHCPSCKGADTRKLSGWCKAALFGCLVGRINRVATRDGETCPTMIYFVIAGVRETLHKIRLGTTTSYRAGL